MKNWIFKDEPSSPPDPKAARTRALLLSLPFAIVGILALVFLLHDEVLSGFAMKKQMAMGLLSAAIVCGGLIALIFGISAKKEAQKISAADIDDAGKPWLKRKDWAAGRIASGTRKSVLLIWIFTLFWNAVSTPVVLIGLPAELHKGNHAILIALLFPMVGIGMILYALNATLAWRKFGQSLFEMAAIPGALGGTLEGEIQVKTRLQPRHGLHLRLSCIRQRTTGSGKNRNTTEIILWQDEKWLRPDLPQTDLNATGIPVFFKLPAGQPESTVAAGDGIHWKLEAAAKLRGPNFHATFEVPVFKLPGPPDISEDPTTPYQMPLDEVRQQLHSKIRVNDLPDGGKEFIFPAARNPGVATLLTLIWLVFAGVFIVLIWQRAPFVFPIGCGVAVLLIGIFAFNLWFLRRCVVVTPAQVTVKTSSLILKKERAIAAADITGFGAEPGMTVGHSAYYDLKIHAGGTGGITAASSIADKPEADWLVQQMSAALKKCCGNGLKHVTAKPKTSIPPRRGAPKRSEGGWRGEIGRVLITEEQIARRVKSLAREIERDFRGRELVVVSVLNGTVMFFADLIRHLNLPLRLDFMGVSSYGPGTESGDLVFTKELRLDVRGRDVLLVDDILDTGKTMCRVLPKIRALKPLRIKICVLLDKPSRRVEKVKADYAGFEIPDLFVVGYGLDFAEQYRNLPFVGALHPHVYKQDCQRVCRK